MTELKPCPFCGGKAKLRAEGHIDAVRCLVCKAEGPSFMDHIEAAIVAWNHRVGEDKP